MRTTGMGKYTVNIELNGFERTDIASSALENSNNTVIILLDSSTNDKLCEYYTKVGDMLAKGTKVYIITLNNESSIQRQICSLLVSYRNYNIYCVDNIMSITSEYVENIISRNPTYDEVQTFIDSDILAYSDISCILNGIADTVNRGDVTGLITFTSQHLNVINSLMNSINFMKTVIDSNNRQELQSMIGQLKDQLLQTTSRFNTAEADIRKYREEADKYKSQMEYLRDELSGTKTKLEMLSQNIDDTQVIKSYSEINTAMINCKARVIIYFKEISKIPYINSFVSVLTHAIGLKNLRVKLLIYDNKSSLTAVYKPLNIVGSNEYIANKDGYTSKIDRFVVVEPNPCILQDILTYNNPAYDVVIVYDRLGQLSDLVVGNNIQKFFVIGSNKDYKETQTLFRINDRSSIITRSESGIGTDVLDIPYIEDYRSQTDAAKVSKYMKLVTSAGNKSLMHTILERSRVNTL